LQRVTERLLGINRLCEPSLVQLDRAHESSRAFRSAVGKGEVGMLIPMTNQRMQVPRSKIVLRDDLIPDIRIFSM
jgi:hypothetical protein